MTSTVTGDRHASLVGQDLFRGAQLESSFSSFYHDEGGPNTDDGLELSDMCLIGADDVPIPAIRFVLAARCPVLRRMLYGSFREAQSSSICLMAYDSLVLRAIVEFCSTNQISHFANHLSYYFTTTTNNSAINSNHGTSPFEIHPEQAARWIVQLAQAADYLGLSELEQQATTLARDCMMQSPALACAVWDESTPGSTLHIDAQTMIECRPYVVLDDAQSHPGVGLYRTNSPTWITHYANHVRAGGIECLSDARIIELYRNPNIAAGEAFLLEMLQRWVKVYAKKYTETAAFDIATQCLIRFEDIDPKKLLNPTTLQTCPWVPRERVYAAVAMQALRASHDRVWRIRCRGKQTEVERVLVEGAGMNDANGVYYHISKLAHGDLYSKRELACAQQNVYTLSCCRRDDMIECRIFSTPLLTSGAVTRMARSLSVSTAPPPFAWVDPTFQPVLQIYRLDIPLRLDETLQPSSSTRLSSSPNSSFLASTSDNLHRVLLSDGTSLIPGTLAQPLRQLVESEEIRTLSVVKILEFGLYERGDPSCAHIHISKLAIVISTAAYRFGNPSHLPPMSHGKESPITTLFDQLDGSHFYTEKGKVEQDGLSNGLRQLYSCTYSGDNQSVGSGIIFSTKIPSSGWKVEQHGSEPSPHCDWLSPEPSR